MTIRSSGAQSAPAPIWPALAVVIPIAGKGLHLLNPRDVVPESNMPAYYWLDRPLKDATIIGAKMAALRMVGVPYTDQEIADAPEALEGKSELDALVAYLQGLGLALKPVALNPDMDINDLRSISTVLAFVAFIVMVRWVYSASRKQAYEEAGKLPLDDDEPAVGEAQRTQQNKERDSLWISITRAISTASGACTVIVITLVSIVGCAVFLWLQGAGKFKPGEVTGHVWDETLEEYSNPLPNWWRWMFYLTVFFALAYLAVYPGLGSMSGSFKWSMRGQYDKEMAAAEAKYGPKFNQFLKQDVMTVAANQEAREMGGRLFQTYCAQCHASDAGGLTGFPNLKDGDWLWGGSPDKIKESISNGRFGVMTPKGTKPDMDADQVKDVVNYVRSLSGLTHDSVRAQRGKELFPQACLACHGPEAKGNPDAGYPNLTDNVWLYRSTEESMIENGHQGPSKSDACVRRIPWPSQGASSDRVCLGLGRRYALRRKQVIARGIATRRFSVAPGRNAPGSASGRESRPASGGIGRGDIGGMARRHAMRRLASQ